MSCIAKITFLYVNTVVNLGKILAQVGQDVHQVIAQLHTGVVLIVLLVEIELGTLFHQERVLVEIVHILGIVTAELVMNGSIELGQIFLVDLLLIVLEHGCKDLLVGGFVPLIAVVLELQVLLGRLPFTSMPPVCIMARVTNSLLRRNDSIKK